jgi:nucleoside-diphosphate-sugar epimerase/predicted dehydrogenase
LKSLNTSKTLADKDLRIAVIGAGYIFESHLRAIRHITGARIVAVVDLSLKLAEAAAARCGAACATNVLLETLPHGVNCIHVLTPADKHIGIVRQAIELGLHVFCEKPFVLKHTEALELSALAKARGVQLAVNHNFLFTDAYERMRADVNAGFFGPLQQINVVWSFPLGLLVNGPFGTWMAAKPENLFHELGPHLVSFGVDLLGDFKIEGVEAFDRLEMQDGGSVFRRWTVLGSCGDTRIHLDLSARIAAVERYINVRGLAATGECHYDKNIYTVSELHSLNPLFDDVFDAGKRAVSITRQLTRNFFNALVGSLRRDADVNAYGSTFKNSVSAFYRSVNAGGDSTDHRLTPSFASKVVSICEDVSGRVTPNSVQHGLVLPEMNATNSNVDLSAVSQLIVLVTGATGFIGKELVKRLVAAGRHVKIISRSQATAASAFPDLMVDVLIGQLSDPVFLENALKGVSIVYHLAKGDGKNWNDYLVSDVQPTLAFAKACEVAQIERFVYTGTIDSYYSGDASEKISGSTPLDPKIASRNHYARAKATSEEKLLEMHRASGFPVAILRPGIVIGKGFSPAHWGVGMFFNSTNMMYWGDGKHKLPFVLVDDVADALVSAGTQSGIVGKTLLLTADESISGREYVTALGAALRTKIRAVEGPAWKSYLVDLLKESVKHLTRHPNRKTPSFRDWCSRQHIAHYDSSEARTLLNWQPCNSREELIRRGIEAPAHDLTR